jgi:HlyD family secretion protein
MISRVVKVGLALGLILAIAGGVLYWRVVREIPVRTAGPQQNVEVRVFGIGTIEAQVLSKVGFQIAGRLVSLEADQGDFVKTGALLAKLDDAAQRAKLAKSEATKSNRRLRTWPGPRPNATAPRSRINRKRVSTSAARRWPAAVPSPRRPPRTRRPLRTSRSATSK